jgi:hypothetical protein
MFYIERSRMEGLREISHSFAKAGLGGLQSA